MAETLPGEMIHVDSHSPDPNRTASENSETGKTLEFLLDVPLKITVELGSTDMPVKGVIQLAVGSVIPLSKFAGEPLEIFINGRLISRGEVVVVNEKYGVRLTDLISPADHTGQDQKR